ncbi:uncharacterized protein EHS24_004043 [Apiotrichum porosum]|uniref:Uncharacterized protein n=1 Tax=Apiotrichum porosum TaxID=105984 RepID=A0A427Y452_9TREE|nr:uncharacterized protein EHS24_004043 [Apiotrichum porosum]RSH85862.1 hypothetical protein EHS24_004043 [Apiotrichum porosum]
MVTTNDDSKVTKGGPSYAQVAATPAGPSDAAPPPYSHDQVIYPAGRVHVPAPNQHAQYAQHSGGGGEHQPIYQPQTPAQAEGGGVLVYISPYDIALMRARRRFFGAVFWAFVIYLVVGLLDEGPKPSRDNGRESWPRLRLEALARLKGLRLSAIVGDGISEANRKRNGGHWDKHGRWHDGKGITVYAGGAATAAPATSTSVVDAVFAETQ